MKKLVVLAVMVLLGGILWLSRGETVGELREDKGRKHISEGTLVWEGELPTSGDHYEEWTKPGFYETVIDQGYLLHSLEHGYIVISYKCTKSPITNFQFSIFEKAFAHEDPTSSPSAEAEGTSLGAGECEQLKQMLREFFDKNTGKRLVIVAEPKAEKIITLRAWRRILKLDQWDGELAEKFVKAWHNKGPEKTMEKLD